MWCLLCCVGCQFACVVAPVRWLLRQDWPKLRQALYFPLAGQVRWEHATQRQILLQRLGAVEVDLTTADERTVHGVWFEPREMRANGSSSSRVGSAAPPPPPDGSAVLPSQPVVLLLHANAMVLDDMSDWAVYYLSLGCSVLCITFWGYPDPAEEHGLYAADGGGATEGSPLAEMPEEGAYCPTELSLYLDAEAGLQHLLVDRRVPLDRILVHGLSIGGAAACALGVHHPGLRVTVDQTFASMHQVSAHVGCGLFEQLVMQRAPRWARRPLLYLAPVLVWLASGLVVAMAFRRPAAAAPHAAACAALDHLDNVGKAARMRGDLFVLHAEHDEMMPARFAEQLLIARYGKSQTDLRAARSLRVPGGHCSFFGDVPELRTRYRTYLKQEGFLT
jgi:dienelactone hydrolase